MPRVRHLRNAPITEAIFDFRVKAQPGFRAEGFADLKPQLADRFPKTEDRHKWHASFEIIEGKGLPPALDDRGLHGYFFKDAEEKTVVQFRVDGFTFNRLHPYTSWNELFPLVLELWRLYSAVARPEVITRLAVRYINRIPIPVVPFEFATYLRAAPVIPPELPQNVSTFLTRVTISDSVKAVAAHIVQTLESKANGLPPDILFDVDAFKDGEYAIDSPLIVETFNRLRDFKNLIFFNCVTDEALRQFE